MRKLTVVAACLVALLGTVAALHRTVVAPAPGTQVAAGAIAAGATVSSLVPPPSTEPPVPPSTTVTTAPPTTLPPPPAPPPTTSPIPPRDAPVVLVVGDSIADFTAQALTEAAAPTGAQIVDDAMWGCGVMSGGPLSYVGRMQDQPEGCDDWPARWQAAVDTTTPNVSMLMVGRWEVVDRVMDAATQSIGEPGFDQVLEWRLEQAVAILTSRGGHVVITTAPYYRRSFQPDGSLWPEDEPGRVDRFNQIVTAIAARHPGQVFLSDFNAMLTPGGYTDEVDGIRVRRDGVHLTSEGSALAAGWLLPQLLTASASPAG